MSCSPDHALLRRVSQSAVQGDDAVQTQTVLLANTPRKMKTDRPVENIFELIHFGFQVFGELVPAVFTGLGVWGIDPVMNRSGM
eukprot:4936934-Amphidinium_carterae.1